MSATVDEPECRDCGEPITLAEAPTMKPCGRCGFYMHAECGMGIEGDSKEYCETCYAVQDLPGQDWGSV